MMWKKEVDPPLDIYSQLVMYMYMYVCMCVCIASVVHVRYMYNVKYASCIHFAAACSADMYTCFAHVFRSLPIYNYSKDGFYYNLELNYLLP